MTLELVEAICACGHGRDDHPNFVPWGHEKCSAKWCICRDFVYWEDVLEEEPCC